MTDQQTVHLKTILTPVCGTGIGVLDTLTEGLTSIEDHTIFENASAFMPVSVECIGAVEYGKLYSVAHYYKQNGDLMRDPEIVFLKDCAAQYYPISYQQDGLGLYQEVVRFEGDIINVQTKTQKSIARFCTTWMANIYEQQFRHLVK